jgi:hypothetical protein
MSAVTEAIAGVYRENGYFCHAEEAKTFADDLDAAVLVALEPPELTEEERGRLAKLARDAWMATQGNEILWGVIATALYRDITSRHPVRGSALPLSDADRWRLAEEAYKIRQKQINTLPWLDITEKGREANRLMLDYLWVEFNKRTSVSFAEVHGKLPKDRGFRVWGDGSGCIWKNDSGEHEQLTSWQPTDDPSAAVLSAIESLPKPTEAEDDTLLADYLLNATHVVIPSIVPEGVRAAMNRKKERKS